MELQQLGHCDEALLVATKTMKLVLGLKRDFYHSQLLSSGLDAVNCLEELSFEFSMCLKVVDINRII